MGDSHKAWLVSIASGLELTNDWRINTIRLFFYIGLIAAWFFPAAVNLSSNGCITFAFIVSICIFILKIILAILNAIINHTKSVTSKTNTNNIKQQSEYESNEPPEGIPQELWDMRRSIPRDGPITENVFSELIEKGFDTSVVLQFVQVIVDANKSNDSDLSDADKETTKEILEIFGHEFVVPFNRHMIDSMFGANYSFIYVFVVFFFTTIMSFIGAYLMPHFPIYVRYWLAFIYGPALYSTIHPPEVDAYSTTRGDYYIGITRPLSIIILGGFYLYFLKGNSFEAAFEELKFPIPCAAITRICKKFFFIGLIAFPLWSILFIGHPTIILNWIIEWASRYLFGHSGATGVGNSIILALRSCVLGFTISEILGSEYTRTNLAFCCCFAVGVLQIPMKTSFTCLSKPFKTFFFVLLMCFLAFIGCYVGFRYSYRSGDFLFCFALLYTLIVDVIWPYISSVNAYFFFTMRLVNVTSNTMSSIKFLTPAFIAPMVIGLVFYKERLSPLLAAFVIITCITKSMTEPHVFAFALILEKFCFEYEFQITHPALYLFYALMLTRKILSVMSVLDYWMRIRVHYFANKYELFDSDDILLTIRDYFISTLLMILPFSDRTFSFLTLSWSLITGAPFHVPQSFPFIHFPFPPRPNSFWNQIFAGNIDVTRAYLQHRTEHPIETPVYTSMTYSLSRSLKLLVNSGKLGIVSSNSFFLFLSEPLAAFVHIISIEPNAINFQLRGLEYNDETICHLGELARLKDDVSSYQDHIPNISSAAKYYSTSWKTRAIGIKLWQYNISRVDEENAFIGVDRQGMDLWTSISLAKNIKPKLKDNDQIVYENDGELTEQFTYALDIFNIKIDSTNKKKLKYIWEQYIDCIFTDDALDLEKLFNVFHGSVDPVFQATAQTLVLFLSLASMQNSPEDETKESLITFLADVDEKFLVAPVQSSEFNSAFEKEEKDLVSYEDTADGRSILFFIQTEVIWDVLSVQKEVVRSYWASEAFLQIFIGEDNTERLSIQEDDHTMRNLIVQACDTPIGYPAFVSPIIMSYCGPSYYESNF